MQLIITINTGTPAQQVKKCTIFVDHDLILSLSAWPGVIESLQRNNTVCCCLSDVTHCSLYTHRSVYRLSTARSVVVCLTSHTVLCTHSDLCPSVYSTVCCCLSDVTHCSPYTRICVLSVHSTVCCSLSDVTHCSLYTHRSVYRLSTSRSVVDCLTSHTVLGTHSDLPHALLQNQTTRYVSAMLAGVRSRFSVK